MKDGTEGKWGVKKAELQLVVFAAIGSFNTFTSPESTMVRCSLLVYKKVEQLLMESNQTLRAAGFK